MNILQLQLDSVYEEKAKGAFVRSRRKWREEREKNRTYVLSLEKRNVEMSALVKLNINGQTTEEPEIKHSFTKQQQGTLVERRHGKRRKASRRSPQGDTMAEKNISI